MKTSPTSLILLLLASVSASNFYSPGPLRSIDLDIDELNREALESPRVYSTLELLSGGRRSSLNQISFDQSPSNDSKRKYEAIIAVTSASAATVSDEVSAKKKKTDTDSNDLQAQAAPEPAMDIQILANVMCTFSYKDLRAKFLALGEGIKVSLKENCNWTLLHEAVYTDCIIAAKILLEDFNFNPNSFDPYFGSAMYLIQSNEMAELLKKHNGNILDQRPCYLYSTALEASKSRRALTTVSMIKSFDLRYVDMIVTIKAIQKSSIALKFEAKRENMFANASGIISRRRAGAAKAEVFIRILDEVVIDAGGLTRYFINFIKEEIIKRGKVIVTDEIGRFALRPDVDSIKNSILTESYDETEYNNELKLFGFIVGLSVYHKVPLSIEFQPIINHVLCGLDPHRSVVNWINFVQETDVNYYKSISAIFQFPEDQRQDYTFPEIRGDSNRPYKIARDGINTDEDNKEFMILSAKNYTFLKYERGLRVLKAGFDLAIGSDIYNFITTKELKKLLIGVTDYTAEEWRNACSVPSSEQLRKYRHIYEWFWEIVDEISREHRAGLLKFVTALVALPIGGFQGLTLEKPSVEVVGDNDVVDFSSHYPKASTCFNQLLLFPYSSKEILKEKIIFISEKCSDVFGQP